MPDVGTQTDFHKRRSKTPITKRDLPSICYTLTGTKQPRQWTPMNFTPPGIAMAATPEK